MTPLSYDTDLYAWTQVQAEGLQAKDWSALDAGNLAEEIESLGSKQAHAVESHMTVVLTHLLKWTYQPAQRSRTWRISMRVARKQIARGG